MAVIRAVQIQIRRNDQLSRPERAQLVDLCTAAYEEEFSGYFDLLPPDTMHVVLSLDGEPISHAAWVTRWLQAGQAPLLRTAYVESVATLPGYQRQGYGARVMRQLQSLIVDYDLGGLSPSEPAFYEKLGWEMWRGPLFIRADGALLPTPDEQVMILRLPATPPALDLTAALSAEWREGEVW